MSDSIRNVTVKALFEKIIILIPENVISRILFDVILINENAKNMSLMTTQSRCLKDGFKSYESLYGYPNEKG